MIRQENKWDSPYKTGIETLSQYTPLNDFSQFNQVAGIGGRVEILFRCKHRVMLVMGEKKRVRKVSGREMSHPLGFPSVITTPSQVFIDKDAEENHIPNAS